MNCLFLADLTEIIFALCLSDNLLLDFFEALLVEIFRLKPEVLIEAKFACFLCRYVAERLVVPLRLVQVLLHVTVRWKTIFGASIRLFLGVERVFLRTKLFEGDLASFEPSIALALLSLGKPRWIAVEGIGLVDEGSWLIRDVL